MPVLPSPRFELACGEGREALSGAENGDCVDGEGLDGYFLAVVPVAARLALDVEEPIVGRAERWKVVERSRIARSQNSGGSSPIS